MKYVTVSCVDRLFGQRVNVGTGVTFDEAMKISEREQKANPTSCYRFEFHYNDPGFYPIDVASFFCLLDRRVMN